MRLQHREAGGLTMPRYGCFRTRMRGPAPVSPAAGQPGQRVDGRGPLWRVPAWRPPHAARLDHAHLGRRTRLAGPRGGVLRHADAGEQQGVQRFAEQRRYLAVQERHAGRAGAERVGGQVQPPLGQPRRQLRLAVVPVVEPVQPGRRDDHERGVVRQALAQAHPAQLGAQLPGPRGSREARPPVHARGAGRPRRAPRPGAARRHRGPPRPGRCAAGLAAGPGWRPCAGRSRGWR